MRYFILVFIFCYFSANAQIDESFGVATDDAHRNPSPPETFFEIDFNTTNNVYTFSYHHNYIDMFSKMYFSNGTFQLKKDTFYLKDWEHKFVMKFVKIDEKYLKPIKAYSFVFDDEVRYNILKEGDKDVSDEMFKLKKSDQFKARLDPKLLKAKTKKIPFGIYSTPPELDFHGKKYVELKLNSDYSFDFVDNHVLSTNKSMLKGKWKQKGRYVFLYDENLQFTFNLKITQNNRLVPLKFIQSIFDRHPVFVLRNFSN